MFSALYVNLSIRTDITAVYPPVCTARCTVKFTVHCWQIIKYKIYNYFVWQGYWLNSPNGKIEVAIKILQEDTSPSRNRELLEEARVMASVNHACCVRIQAVCMTARMMLISELLRIGSLLDYVRQHQSELSAHTLLLWAKQIAEVCMLVSW